MLEKMVEGGSQDPFHWYALGLEYAGLGRTDDAHRTFTSLRSKSPDYVPMYLMCGTMLLKAGRTEEGREWLAEGIGVARAKGDTHALSELEEALAGASALR
ncbi:MAG: tetratricopeptide repeat protein [Polyangiaceae bacterium]|nr:tetratricopeptide repeat protein [Polyangiaceae bacterium]